MSKKPSTKDSLKVKGMYRVQITEDGKVVGDSGWKENIVVNLGFNKYLVSALGSIAGSLQVSHLALGSGGAPAATDTSIAGEVEKRQAVTAATSSSSKTVRFTGTFDSANSFLTSSRNLSNVALVNSSATGTIFSGNTYTSSTVATNNNVNVTYDIIFA
jgi:hypothetical protein